MIGTYTQGAPQRATQGELLRADQVQNSAGGFAWAVDDWKCLDRFLILGTEGGSYYASERKLTRENAQVVERLIKDDADGMKVIGRLVEVSREGRAAKNDPAIFALAVCLKLGGPQTRKAAQAAVTTVCRTGTHIFQLAECVKALGGWGRGTKFAFRSWYAEHTEHKTLALQLVKYRQRESWTHRDLLRKIHAPPTPLLAWAAGKSKDGPPDPLIAAFEEVQKTTDQKAAVKLIVDHRLPRECLPTDLLKSAKVWEALLAHMPMTAMVRNLGKMSEVGLLTPLSDAARTVVDRLHDDDALKKARIHPLALLVAERVYASGKGMRGSLTWEPVQPVVDALDEAFYAAFKYVEPTGKRWLLALDVSSSMDSGQVAGSPLTPREASAALALVMAASEPHYQLVAFSHTLVPLDISAKDRLDRVVDKMSSLPFGGTDCSLPIVYATDAKLKVDVFAVYTDSETWVGNVHPAEALRKYRQQIGLPSKSVVVGMVANAFTIADPLDPMMLDVVGMDTETPAAIAEFVRG